MTDGQTDGRTLHDSKDRAYASHRAVKIIFVRRLISLGAFCRSFIRQKIRTVTKKPWNADCAVKPRNKTYKNSAKMIQKFTVAVRPRGTVAPSPGSPPPPEYATAHIVSSRAGLKATSLISFFHEDQFPFCYANNK